MANYIVESALKNAKIFVFGKPKNWKIPFHNHSEILQILQKMHIEKVYVPDCTTFTSKLCCPDDFKDEFKIDDIKIMSGYQAEGLVIPKNEAAVFYTADCPTIIYSTDDKLIAAHAGFGSVVDRLRILNGIPFKKRESVVEEIIPHIRRYENDYEISIVCGIESNYFVYSITDHEYGVGNKKTLLYLLDKYGYEAIPHGIKHGGISISGIIEKQFTLGGVNPNRINYMEINTYSNPNLWSHYQNHKLGRKDCECGRNAVLVINK